MTTPDASAVQRSLLERGWADAAALTARFPDIDRVLKGMLGSVPPFVVDAGGRVVDLQIGNGRYYGRDAEGVARALIDGSLSQGPNISMRMPLPAAMHGGLHAICRDLLAASGFPSDLPDRSSGQANGTRLLFGCGVGLGHHLWPLIERLDPRYLVVYEPSPELLYSASFTVPWRRVIERFDQPGRGLFVVSGGPADVACSNIARWLQSVPMINIDGARLIEHHGDPAFERLKLLLADHIRVINRFPGFFFDERRQFIHTLANLQQTHGIFTESRPGSIPCDLIVVGSGPSLDEALPLLREAQERAVMFSCGTGLAPLQRAGIRPDFHIELETSPQRYALASSTETQDLFTETTLIASNGYYPPSFALFQRRLTFLRTTNFAAQTFRDLAAPLHHGAPTVTNAAIALGQALGFRRIFAFGLDLGYRDPDVQHSRRSLYFDEAKGKFHLNFAHIRGGETLRSFYPESKIEVEDNQGGKLLTNEIFHASWRAFSAFIAAEKPTLVHCGLGARLHGTEVRRIADMHVTDFSGNKAAAKAAIGDRFRPVKLDPRFLAECVAIEQLKLDRMLADVEAIAAGLLGDLEQVRDRVNLMSLRLRDVPDEEVSTRTLAATDFDKLGVFAADLAASTADVAARRRILEAWQSSVHALARHMRTQMENIVPGQGVDPIPGSTPR